MHGEPAAAVVVGLAYVSLALLGWVVYALGREWFNVAVGLLAAAIVLTRVPVLDFGARAYVDIPYLVLVLGALLVETRRPRAGAPVLALLALAGLLRPEAWLFSFAYVVWLLAPGMRSGAQELRRAAAWRDAAPLLALAASGPVLWCLHDLLITHNPLHSLTGTRENAATLGRVTGLDDVALTMPRRIGEILREPVLLAAAGGGLLALVFHRDRRMRLAVAASLLAVAAFTVLAAAGLPIITRYVLLPAALLAIFAGAGVFGWSDLPPGAQRTWWARFGALALLVLVLYIPSQLARIDRLGDALHRQEAIQADLGRLVRDGLRCEPLTVPNRRPIPLLALWLNVDPGAIVDAQDGAPRRGTYLAPRSAKVASDYILDRRDLDRRLPPAPAGFVPVASNASWIATSRC